MSYKVSFHLNMLGTPLDDWIVGDLDGVNIIKIPEQMTRYVHHNHIEVIVDEQSLLSCKIWHGIRPQCWKD